MTLLRRYTPIKRTPIRRKPKQSRIIHRGDREICDGEAWEVRRREVFERDEGRCRGRRCGRFAPLHDERDDYGDVIRLAGHAHHLKGRGLGGGKRDDRLENLEWLCWICHAAEHTSKKVVPKKEVIP